MERGMISSTAIFLGPFIAVILKKKIIIWIAIIYIRLRALCLVMEGEEWMGGQILIVPP